MGAYITGRIRCPYFKEIKKADKTIICEGPERGSVLHLVIGKKEKYERHLDCKCCGDYKSCGIAAMLEKKWANSKN